MKQKTLVYLSLITLFASLSSVAHAQTFSVIYNFTEGADGNWPYAGVTIRENALYGTTSGFSNQSCGTVYQLTQSGSNWLFSSLAALPKDCNPWARVVFGPDGHLYGTSWAGGSWRAGTVFKLTPPVGICKTVACYWAVGDLYDFGPGPNAEVPGFGDLIWDQQGNIFGTTEAGGISGYGTVYELTPSENGYTESVLYSFALPTGGGPRSGLVFDNNGNLFGTTSGGGSNNAGTVFELTYVPGAGWTEHVLYNFQDDAIDVDFPMGGLILDATGNLYGTTASGSCRGGTVFELSPSGDTWTYKLLYAFPDGGDPEATLSMDGAGNLYGTTACGGIYKGGTVFKLSTTENGWVHTSLHDFAGTDGSYPVSNVSIGTDGTLYGTTLEGGDLNRCGGSGCGVVWMIKP
jgi:uncharacterized repeat protein (TIGR03803 family)